MPGAHVPSLKAMSLFGVSSWDIIPPQFSKLRKLKQSLKTGEFDGFTYDLDVIRLMYIKGRRVVQFPGVLLDHALYYTPLGVRLRRGILDLIAWGCTRTGILTYEEGGLNIEQDPCLYRSLFMFGGLEIIRYFLESNKSLALGNPSIGHPLEFVSDFGVIRMLVDYGVDLNKSMSGFVKLPPILHFNEWLFDNKERCKLLISLGANPKTSDSYGSTGIHLAEEPALIQVFLEAGCDINALDDLGNTALDVIPRCEEYDCSTHGSATAWAVFQRKRQYLLDHGAKHSWEL